MSLKPRKLSHEVSLGVELFPVRPLLLDWPQACNSRGRARVEFVWGRGVGVVVVLGSTQLCVHPNFILCWSLVVTEMTNNDTDNTYWYYIIFNHLVTAKLKLGVRK